jgi:membrane protein DedA with SNARE-associated domain
LESTLTSLETWGYLAIAFFCFGGSLVTVAAAGVFAAMGKIDLLMALSVAGISNFMGDNFLFYLARYQKQSIKPYFAKHQRKIAYSNLLFRRYGDISVFVQKFLYGIKTLIPLTMGLSKYPFGKFIFLNIFATAIFVIVIGLAGYYSSHFITQSFDYVSENPWIAPLILFSLIGGVWYFMEQVTKRKD